MVHKMHDQWKALVQRDSNQSGISWWVSLVVLIVTVFTIHSPSPCTDMLSTNTTLTGNPHHISAADAKIIVADTPPLGPAQPIPPEGRAIKLALHLWWQLLVLVPNALFLPCSGQLALCVNSLSCTTFIRISCMWERNGSNRYLLTELNIQTRF